MDDFKEGKVTFSASKGKISKKLEVFYNPFMDFDRDLTVAILNEFKGERYCDALCGSGIRGLRVAKETDYSEIFLNDSSEGAIALAKENAKANGVDATFSCRDINQMLRDYRCDKFDVIDIDPFGSFISSLDSALRAINRKKGLLCLTATDTAPLCGVSINTCQRRYDARPIRTAYAKEVGLRILIAACARMAARYDFALKPLLTYNRGHYFRLYLATVNGKSSANSSLKELSYLQHCYDCDWRNYAQVDRFRGECPNCGREQPSWAGPLWKGDFADPGFCLKLKSKKEKVQELASLIAGEQKIAIPYYDIHHLSKMRKKPAIKQALIMERNSAIKTHFDDVGLRCGKIPEF